MGSGFRVRQRSGMAPWSISCLTNFKLEYRACVLYPEIFSDFTVFYFLFFRGLFFLGWILEFSFLLSIFYLVGGSPRPVSYTQKTFFRFYSFLFSVFSWVVLPRMDFGV